MAFSVDVGSAIDRRDSGPFQKSGVRELGPFFSIDLGAAPALLESGEASTGRNVKAVFRAEGDIEDTSGRDEKVTSKNGAVLVVSW